MIAEVHYRTQRLVAHGFLELLLGFWVKSHLRVVQK